MTEPLDLSRIKTFSIRERNSKVGIEDFSKPVEASEGLQGLLDSLPNILAGKDLREVTRAVTSAHREERGIIWAMGAHVIKCGLNPIIIDLMKRGFITAIALNGAGIIHDFEIAFFGHTSEDVGEGLKEGQFGMARETGELLNRAIKKGVREGLGIGDAVGRWMSGQAPDFLEYSIVAKAFEFGIPLTVHLAIGTDIIHMHPEADGASLGEGSLRDFHRFVSAITTLNKGGVYFNVGSAVILPEVFLKAITLVINLGHELGGFTSVNMDFIQHYRPTQNVIKRPVIGRGKGYSLIGHHEILIPLLAMAIKHETGQSTV